MRPNQHIPLMLIGGAFLAGGLVGGGIAVGTAQGEGTSVPQACVQALDEADAIIGVNLDVSNDMLTLFDALAVNPLDSVAVENFGDQINANADRLAQRDYATPATECRESAK